MGDIKERSGVERGPFLRFERMPDASAADGDKNHNESDWWKWKISRSEFAFCQWRDDNTKFVKRLSPWEYADFKRG